MEKVKIIIDSSSDLTNEEINKYDVEVVPLTFNIDGQEYDYQSNILQVNRLSVNF